MGMDYVPHNDIELFHLNWGGHRYMAELLDGLGADMDTWTGTNDGDEIPSKIAAAWADLLEDALAHDRIKDRRYADQSYEGGFAKSPEVKDPVNTEFREIYEQMDALVYKSRDPRGEPEIVDITTETKDWIKDFAAFLRKCGGCSQC